MSKISLTKKASVFVLALLMAVGMPAGAVATDCDAPPSALIAALDKILQSRFRDTSAGLFGIRRLGPGHMGELRPETEAEVKVLSDIKNSGWEAVVFLVGRQALESGDVSKVHHPFGVTGSARRQDLPQTSRLEGPARQALKAFGRDNAFDFREGQWFIAARPVRASKPECLDCHSRPGEKTAPRLGDPLGARMYAFTPRP